MVTGQVTLNKFVYQLKLQKDTVKTAHLPLSGQCQQHRAGPDVRAGPGRGARLCTTRRNRGAGSGRLLRREGGREGGTEGAGGGSAAAGARSEVEAGTSLPGAGRAAGTKSLGAAALRTRGQVRRREAGDDPPALRRELMCGLRAFTAVLQPFASADGSAGRGLAASWLRGSFRTTLPGLSTAVLVWPLRSFGRRTKRRGCARLRAALSFPGGSPRRGRCCPTVFGHGAPAPLVPYCGTRGSAGALGSPYGRSGGHRVRLSVPGFVMNIYLATSSITGSHCNTGL